MNYGVIAGSVVSCLLFAIVGYLIGWQSRLESLEKDAARYRWFRNGNAYAPEEAGIIGGYELDELCDTAMQANKGE